MTPTEAALRAALEEAEEHLQSCCPTDGWGCRDRGADADREETLRKVRAALAAPPHGKDAGEETKELHRFRTHLKGRPNVCDNPPSSTDLMNVLCDLENERDAIQARLAVAEGWLRQARKLLEAPDVIPYAFQEEWENRVSAFLKEGGT